MPRVKTEQVRVRAYELTRALRAAAAFTDANKKSHRHRICLRTTTWTDDAITTPTDDIVGEKSALVAAAGGPLRVLAVMAGEVKTLDEFAIDITPGAAALIVKLFSQAGEVELSPAWGAILDTGVDDEWRGDLVTLQHLLLDGALPRRAVTIVPGSPDTSEPTESDSEPIDLDTLDEDEPETFASALLQRGGGTVLTDADGTTHINVTIPASDAFADDVEAIA